MKSLITLQQQHHRRRQADEELPCRRRRYRRCGCFLVPMISSTATPSKIAYDFSRCRCLHRLLLSSASTTWWMMSLLLVLLCDANVMMLTPVASMEQEQHPFRSYHHEEAAIAKVLGEQQQLHKAERRQPQPQPQYSQRHLEDSDTCNLKNQMISTCQSFDGYIQSTYGTPMTTFTTRVTIPCGLCVQIDQNVTSTYTFNDGLDIQGKFLIDCHDFVNPQFQQIYTTFLLIQGDMKIDATCQLPVEGQPLVRITMISKSDNSTSTYTPLDVSIAATCNNSHCDVGEKSITVTGYGQVDLQGLDPATPSWVKLYNVTYDLMISTNNPIGIVVPNTVQNLWTVGSLLVISSFTTQWDQYQQVRTITGMQNSNTDPDYVEITLNETIVRPITQIDNIQLDIPYFDTSVEVMLLSKNIVLTTSEVITKNQTIVGGHFWFYFTKSHQKVSGVDIQNFGQQGILGKYPLHYHFCTANTLNILSKNTIRHSLQRCIVIHGTNNVTVLENVAYDTTGHCYMLEDGIETYNQFISNIGIMTKQPTYIIPPNPIMKNGNETDGVPATFWITNPTNVFINNVAGGSIHSGFWFQLQKRGIMASYFPTINPKVDPIGTFMNNVAHSNAGIGLRCYPTYVPKVIAIISTMQLYRNNAGINFRIASNINMNNCYWADNAVGIAFEQNLSPPTRFNNITIVGETNSFYTIVRNQSLDSVCSKNNFNIGIRLPTWKGNVGTTGSIWQNIQFYNFNHASCNYISPVTMFLPPKGTVMFDDYTTMENVEFNDKEITKIDLCFTNRSNVKNIYITDLDGSLKPYHIAATTTATTNVASIVSLQQTMLQFVNTGNCTPVRSRCYAYCQDTCFRGILFGIDPATKLNFQLKLCSNSDTNNCITVPGYRRNFDPTDSSYLRYFPAYLPIGQYNAVFLDESGIESWPTFVQQLITDTTCPLSGTHAVTMKVPQVSYNQCIELIRNGNADASNTEPIYWLKQGGGLQVLPGGGVDGTNAFASVSSNEQTVLVQFLDSRCLNLMKNHVYEVYADIQLRRRDGSVYICDPKVEPCPTIGVLGSNSGMASNDDFVDDDSLVLETESGVDGTYANIAEITTASLNSFGFQSITGTVNLTDQLIKKQGVFLYIQSSNFRLIVDNVSLKLANATSAPTRTYCFSSSTLVNVRDTGYVSISQLKIGDHIRAGNGHDYTQVYGFGHYDHNMAAEFLQIHLIDESDPVLEISPNHLVFVRRRSKNSSTESMIPAAALMVNDILNSNMVRSIHRVVRRGVYAPLTQSGDFQVNGIRVSSYVEILQNPYNMVWDQHRLGHACFLPQRIFCKYFMNVCQKETYINGYGITASMVVHVGRLINEQGWFVNMIAFIFAFLIIGISFVVERLCSIPFPWLLVAFTGAIVIKICRSMTPP